MKRALAWGLALAAGLVVGACVEHRGVDCAHGWTDFPEGTWPSSTSSIADEVEATLQGDTLELRYTIDGEDKLAVYTIGTRENFAAE